MTNMFEIMKKRLSEQHKTLADMQRDMDIPYTTIRSWQSKGGHIPSFRVPNVAKYLGVSPNYLYNVDDGAVHDVSAGYGINKVHRIPFYDVQTKMGEGNLAVEEPTAEYLVVNAEQGELLSRFDIVPEQAKDYFLCTIAGDSMAGTIESGDVCLMKHCDQMNGDGIYLLNTPEGNICKRLQRVNQKIQVISDNTAYPSYFIEDLNTRVIGKLHCSLNVKKYH